MQRLPLVLLASALSTACGSDQPCWYSSFDLRDGGTVVTYEELDRYRGSCVVVTGTLTVGGREIEDLGSLEGVVGVTGSLRLKASKLASTSGLDALEFVQGGVRVSDSFHLLTVELDSLTTIGGDLIVERLPRLVSVGGFSSLDEVAGDVVMRRLDSLTVARLPPFQYIGGSLRLEDNELLDSVVEPDTLFEIGGDLEISQSHWLRRVEGFGALEWLHDDVRISHHDWDRPEWFRPPVARVRERGAMGAFVIVGNRLLEEVNGFESLRSVEDHLSITSNRRLRRVGGLSVQLTAPAAEVWIDDNAELTELPALRGYHPRLFLRGSAVTTLADLGDAAFSRVELAQNPALASLDGLNLADGWSELSVVDNDLLTSVQGIGIAPANSYAGLRLLRNGSLTSVSALESMAAHPPGQAIIADNPELSQSYASSLVERLGSMEGKAAGNLGWHPPVTCPWQDGICDELPRYGVVLCPPDSDEADCGI